MVNRIYPPELQYNGLFSRRQIFAVLSKKTRGLFFADFNFRGRRRPRKIISILFREIHRVGGTTRLSLYRTNVQRKSPAKRIEDTCSLTDKQTKRTYLHSDG